MTTRPKYGSTSPHARHGPMASSSDSKENKDSFFGSNTISSLSVTHNKLPKAAGMALGYSSVWAFEIMSHPFIVFRRSCQISQGHSRHIHPFTLIPVVFNLSSNKPPVWMYKGFVSTLLTRSMTMVTENVINEATSWPLNVSTYSSVKRQCQHLFLKWTGFLLTAPFHVSSFVESVQSYGANDYPGIFEFFIEGCNRMMGRGLRAAWIMPMWKLLLPTATFRLVNYILQQVVTHLILRIFHEIQEEEEEQIQPETSREQETEKEIKSEQVYPRLIAAFGGSLFADVVLLPIETVLHRLYIQGTRVLTDNMEHGREVLGVKFQYSGFTDCFWQILCNEGAGAFYRGLGAVVLQYTFHYLGLKLLHYAMHRLSPDNSSGKRMDRRVQMSRSGESAML